MGKQSRVDEVATHRMLHDLLLSKGAGDDSPAELVAASGPTTPTFREPSVRATRSNTLSQLEVTALPSLLQESDLERERFEREKFMQDICSATTRPEVQEWVRKIFDLSQEGRPLVPRRDAQERKRRVRRSSIDMSESSLSVITGPSGNTPRALQAAGGSIAGAAASLATASNGMAKSVDSAESLVVHHSSMDEPLSIKDRLKAWLGKDCPALEEHVNAHVRGQMEALQRRLDDELATKFMRETQQKRVFDKRANFMRWQVARRHLMQKHLDEQTSSWILDAVESWNQRKEKQVNPEKDIIFDLLTKRAAHIDSGKLPSEIPICKALHSSYSLPSMWKDKYLS